MFSILLSPLTWVLGVCYGCWNLAILGRPRYRAQTESGNSQVRQSLRDVQAEKVYLWKQMWIIILKAMRNLVYRVGPKTPDSPPSGHGPKFWGSSCHASKHIYLLCCCHVGTPEAPQEINIGHLWSYHVSYTSIWCPNWGQSGTI